MQPPEKPPSHAPGLLSAELEKLLRSRARIQRLEKKDSLYLYGSTPDALFYVERGLVRLSVTGANGREAVLSAVPPGHWFGEASLFIEQPRIHDARAVVDSELLVVSRAAFHEIVDNRPDFLLEFMRLICSRYRLLLEQVDASVLLPLPVRLAQRLLTLSTTQSSIAEDETGLTLRISQEDLANMLGVSRQSVNRQLKEWEADGILQLKYGGIGHLERSRLRALVRDDSLSGE